MEVSYQLYSSRNLSNLPETLAMVSEVGYKNVEGYGALYEDLERLIALLAENHLSMPTGHFGLNQIEDECDKMLNVAKVLNMKAVIVPYILPEERPVNAEGWVQFGRRLAKAGKPFLDAGISFGWHNHNFEFNRLPTGEMPMELIADNLGDGIFELDVAWIIRAGEDPIEWINRLGGQIQLAHIKDIAQTGECEDEDGWADVGQGIVDWAPIHAALQEIECRYYVMEHDNPNDDRRFATRSLAAVKKF